MGISTQHHPATRECIWQMLQCIPAHDRDTWITVGMALKEEVGDNGYSLFDQWSQSAKNYNAQAVKSVWRSFKSGAVSIASLFYLAKKHGWQNGSTSENFAPKPLIVPKERKPNTQAYALRLWLAANTDDSVVAQHPYAIDKGIDWAAGAGCGKASGSIIGSEANCVIVPIRSIHTNRVQGVQCINFEGRKQTFGRVSGGALILGNTLDLRLPWYVCEGWASAVSMVFHHQKGNGLCAASFGKSNLDKAAEKIAETYQPEEIIVLREQD